MIWVKLLTFKIAEIEKKKMKIELKKSDRRIWNLLLIALYTQAK